MLLFEKEPVRELLAVLMPQMRCVCVCVNIFDSNFMSSYLIRNSCLHLEERVLINQNHMITSAAQTVLRLNTPTRVTDLSANHTTAV